MTRQGFILSALPLAALATLAACGGGGGSDDDSPKTVTIEFAAVAGNTPIGCGSTVSGLGSGGVDAKLQDFRFYVSNVKLVKADGTEVALTLPADDDWNHSAGGNAVTLIDLEDGSGGCSAGTSATHTSVTGTVPAGDYVGVRMTMGVPFALNHTDYASAPAPLDVQAMAWSWQSGRKFAKIEVVDPDGSTGTWAAHSFYVHLGSTGCSGNPANGETVSCVAANRMDFALAAFDPATQKIAVDLRALLAGNDITRNQAGAPGCMSGGTDPECAAVFQALAIGWNADGSGSGLPVDGGAAQTLFRAVAK